MSYRFSYIIIFLLLINLVSCKQKNERIEGSIQDIFSSPLQGVSVKVQKSEFYAITDGTGTYSIDYVPGQLKLIFSKEGYTTHYLDLNIQQKSYFPAEKITLFPIPKGDGIFYVDYDKKKLVRLKSTGRIEKTIEDTSTLSLRKKIYYRIEPSKDVQMVKSGEAIFIDKSKYPLSLARFPLNGFVYEGYLNIIDRKDIYSTLLYDEKIAHVGQEKLLVRKFNPVIGSFIFLESISNRNIGILPKDNGAAFEFQVEGTEVDLDDADKEKEEVAQNFFDSNFLSKSLFHKNVKYNTVLSPYTGRIWLDRNIGAQEICKNKDDTECYGDYYQWGRNRDGHEKLGSPITDLLATDIHNAGAKFILNQLDTRDWLNSDQNGLARSANWRQTDGSSVCPVGFRVPTAQELKAETTDVGVKSNDDGFNSFLRLPSSGYRKTTTSPPGLGAIRGAGELAILSTSNAPCISLALYKKGASWNNTCRPASGRSVRCIQAD